MTDKSHIILKARKAFGRVDYLPVNNVAFCHMRKGENVIPAYVVKKLEENGYNVEIVTSP